MLRWSIKPRFRRVDLRSRISVAMGKLIICVFPAVSHCNSIFGVARALKERGHEVRFAGAAELRPVVERQGYAFVPWEPTRRNPLRAETLRPYSYWDGLIRWRELRRSVARELAAIADCASFDGLVKAYPTHSFLVDAHYTLECLSLVKAQMRFATFSTKVCLNRASGVPPLDSHLCLRPGRLFALRCRLAWGWRQSTQRLRQGLGVSTVPTPRVLRKATQRAGCHLSDIEFDRRFVLGLRIAPEFILSPPEFDFPRRLAGNQEFVGPYVDMNRQEDGFRFGTLSRIAEIEKKAREGVPVVYCALGGMPWLYPAAAAFLGRLIAAASGAGWELVLARGPVEVGDPGAVPYNVHVFETVPQVKILGWCRMMITHGGMNSIKECIMSAVPMMIYPGNTEIDQPGNAARAVFHGLGILGNMRRDSVGRIRRHIESMLTTDRFSAATARMRNSILQSEAFNHGFSTVERQLLS